MTEKEYRTHPAISRSELWRIHESPEKFKWFKDHPPDPTPSLLFGQVVHKLILQPETFDEDFVLMPDIDRRTKAGREAFDSFMARLEGRSAVLEADVQKAEKMANAVRQNRLAAKLLEDRHDIVTLNSQHEVPFFWTDPDTGEECKCRCDALTVIDDRIVIVDYKTARDASTSHFNLAVARYGYDFQAGMYTEGVMKALNLEYRPCFIFVAQETTPPYSINIFNVSDDVVTHGVDLFREYIGTYARCAKLDYWPGYNGFFGEPNEVYIQSWVVNEDGE